MIWLFHSLFELSDFIFVLECIHGFSSWCSRVPTCTVSRDTSRQLRIRYAARHPCAVESSGFETPVATHGCSPLVCSALSSSNIRPPRHGCRAVTTLRVASTCSAPGKAPGTSAFLHPDERPLFPVDHTLQVGHCSNVQRASSGCPQRSPARICSHDPPRWSTCCRSCSSASTAGAVVTHCSPLFSRAMTQGVPGPITH